MKKILISFVCCIILGLFFFHIFLARASGGITLVQKSFSVKQWSSTNATTLPTNATAGNMLIVAVTQYSNPISSLSDNQGDVFTLIDTKQAFPGGDYTELYYAKNIHGGPTTVSFTLTSASDTNIGVYEFSGIDSVTPLDTKVSASGHTTAPNAGNLTTTADGELYFVLGVDDSTSLPPAAGTGYTLLDHQDDSGGHERYYTEYKIVNHGTYAASFTINPSSSWAVVGAAFKPSTISPTPTIIPTPTLTPTSTPSPVPSATPTPTTIPTPSITNVPTGTPTLTPTPSANPSSNLNKPDHVVIVVEENQSLQNVLGKGYFTQLANQGALFVQSFGLTHPSAPNYMALFSGSTQGVSIDNCPFSPQPFTDANLASQLFANGMSFAGYSEGLTTPGQFSCDSGAFIGHHDPWEAFSNVPMSTNLAFSNFPTDYSQLPTVSFVVPTNANNAHDGTVSQAASWLQTNIDAYAKWAMTHNSLLIVTFDEDDNSSLNLIYTVFVGPMVKQGIYNETINHYNVLSTVENLYNLPLLNPALPVTDIFK